MRVFWYASLASMFVGVGASCTQQKSPPDSRIETLPIPSPAAIARVAALPSPYNQGDALKGRLVFGECVECHSLEANGSQDKGPELGEFFGRPAARGKNFAYSEALRKANIVWDARHLDQWIFNPHETLPGTSMTYVGIRNDSKRRDLIAYLIAVTN